MANQINSQNWMDNEMNRLVNKPVQKERHNKKFIAVLIIIIVLLAGLLIYNYISDEDHNDEPGVEEYNLTLQDDSLTEDDLNIIPSFPD